METSLDVSHRPIGEINFPSKGIFRDATIYLDLKSHRLYVYIFVQNRWMASNPNYWKRRTAGSNEGSCRVIAIGPPAPVVPLKTGDSGRLTPSLTVVPSASVAVPPSQRFGSNSVYTTKYNVLTFLPKFLAEQFSKYTNFFFLVISMFQQIPGISPTNKYASIVGLSFVLFMSAVKELIEDARRRKSDVAANNARVLRYDYEAGSFVRRKWAELRVGDLVHLTRGQQIPADLVVLQTSEPGGLCFVETSNIDGETNLKIRQAPEQLGPGFEPRGWRATVECEHPNDKIYAFEGKLVTHGERIGGESVEVVSAPGDAVPLGPEQLLLRGAILRNTDWLIGLVVYTGSHTKLMQNSKPRRFKMTKMERECNKQMIWVFVFLIMLSIVSAAMSLYLERHYFTAKYWYLRRPQQGGSETETGGRFFLTCLLRFFTFTLLYHNLVPLNLLMTMEIVRYKLAQLIASDMLMYDEDTDTPTVCKSSTIIEELGQVEYVLSDKTGTLTCNQMELKHFVAGERIVKDCRLSPQDLEAVPDDGPAQVDFKRTMALCHTVVIEKTTTTPMTLPPSMLKHEQQDATLHHSRETTSTSYSQEGATVQECEKMMEKDKLLYQASSPDELAIVEACRDLGYTFWDRSVDTVTLQLPDGTLEVYRVLAVIEFTSSRKRMSVLLDVLSSADADSIGRRVLLCKGADSVIFELLATERQYIDYVTKALEDFASDGMRTLCFARRTVPRDECDRWLADWHVACATVSQRQQAMDAVSNRLERDLHLLGATAVEDRLQEGVPETIALLREAGIRIWVLTGDRKETAINIGFSCRLLTEGMKIMRIDGMTGEDVRQELQEAARMLDLCEAQRVPAALIIDGRTLDVALDTDRAQFAAVSMRCQAVLSCRCSPLQKALITDVVKTRGQSPRHVGKGQYTICLAVGDGANDVGMIQSAQIGVGISGREGLQAAQAADFSIAQFRFLQRLLLVHGSWSYHRMSKVVQFCMYKNLTLYLGQAIFVLLNGFSGQSLYDTWMLSFYNVFFTFWPIVFVGLNDQYVQADKLLEHPKLYYLGLQGAFFNRRTFWTNAANALYHAVLVVLFVMFLLRDQPYTPAGFPSSHWFQSACIFAVLLNIVTHKTFLIGNYWTFLVFMATYGSLASWFVYTVVFDTISQEVGVFAHITGLARELYTTSTFWVLFVLIPVVALSRDLVWRFLQRWWYRPASYHIVQELQRLERKGTIGPGQVPPEVRLLPPILPSIMTSVMGGREHRARGFSFSQTTGQARVLDAMTQRRAHPSVP
jgi:phospholipid-transporting ATPase